jgi:hypothetical protein
MSDTTATPSTAAPGADPLVTPTGVNPQAAIDAATARLFKVKVDGQELEVDEGELLRGYSHNRAASEKMRQASETRALAEQVLSIFKTDPKQAFAKLGVDAKSFAEQVLQEHIEESSLSDEQKELRDLKRFRESIEQKEAREKEEQTTRAEQAFREQVATELQTNIIGALETADLPRNEYTVSRMAYYLESCLQAGFQATPQDVIGHVKAEYDRELKSFLSSVPEDRLLSFVGDDFTKKVVRQHIKATGAKKKAPAQTPVGQSITPSKGEEPGNLRDFFRKR